MSSWIIYAFLALVTWGFWGLFPKLAVKYISPDSALFYEALGSALVGIIIALFFGGRPEFNPRGAIFGMLIGATAVLGGWFYLYAARETNISNVVIVTALYPLITVGLAFLILGEAMTIRQWIAAALAIGAILLLATEKAVPPQI